MAVLGNSDEINELKTYFKRRWGNSVRDYMNEIESLKGKEWCWRDVSREDLTEEQKE